MEKIQEVIRITKLQTKLDNTVEKRKKVESLSQALSNRLSSNSVSDPCEEFSSSKENSKINSLPPKEPRPSRRLAQAPVPRFKGKIVFQNVRKHRPRPAKKNILEDDIPSTGKSISSIPIIKVFLHPTLYPLIAVSYLYKLFLNSKGLSSSLEYCRILNNRQKGSRH